MATKDFFTQVVEGDDELKEYINGLRDLTEIEIALNLKATLVDVVDEVRRFRLAR